jgi:DNA-binding SARP family transcriptional activator
VLIQDAPCEIPAGQPRVLLTYLLLQPEQRALRTTLVEELWPDVPPERGRRYLTDALYRLRRALEPHPLLIADAAQLALDLRLGWQVDLWEFYAASGDPVRRATSLANFLPDLAPEITDHWMLVQRLRLHERFVATALAVAEDAEAAHDPVRAEAIYRQALALDPLFEPAHCGLMRSLARRGQLAAALEHYDALVDRLEQEVATPPSPATRALADQLFQELDLARQRAKTPTLPRLIGRVEERTRLLTALDRARAGKPGLIVLLGDAGIGKSALLHDLARAADWRGWQIHWGNGLDEISPAPYAPLLEALQSALPAPRAAQLAATLPPIWYDLLARLLPALRQTHMRALPEAALAPEQLPQAVAQLLGALQAVTPLLLLLDNVHAGDSALWPLLKETLPLLHQQHTLLVMSGRRDRLQADAAVWAQLEQWDRDGLAQIIALDGLDPAALAELAAQHRQSLSATTPAPPLDRAQMDALYAASGGNPLLAREILASGTPEALLRGRPAIATLLTYRLQQVNAPARQALEAAAVLGSRIHYDHWQALWEAENPYQATLAPQAAELERTGILQITPQGYAFVHDTLHAAALAQIDRPTRRRLHRTALTVLTAPADTNQTPSLDTLRLLYHAQGAEEPPAIARYAQQAGEEALRAFAFARAAAHFSRALAHLPTETEATTETATEADASLQAQRGAALLGRIHAYHVLALRNEEAADLDALAALSTSAAATALVQMRRAEYHLAVAELDAAQQAADAALAQSDALDPVQVATLRLIAARISRDRRQLEVAQSHILTAQQIYRQSDERWGVAMTTDLLGGLAWDQGDYAQAATLHAQAAATFAEIGDAVHESQSLNNLGSTYWELGRYADARATHERSIIVCRELGNKLSEGDNLDNLGGVAWILGDYPHAIRQYRAALELRQSIDDLWGVAISLSNLGSAYHRQGAYAQALDYYERSLPLCRQIARKRNEAYVLHGLGETLLALGRTDEAWARLHEALALRTEIGDRLRLLETHVALVHTALARHDLPAANHHADIISTRLAPSDRAALRQESYYVRFLLAEAQADTERAIQALAQAIAAQIELADLLPPTDRPRFLENVPINRAISAAAQRYTQSLRVELGQAPQTRTITWTVEEPRDQLIDDPTARRRHILARLLAEAAAQAVTPTHDQLATALGVSRRTILRDLAADTPALPSSTPR